LLLALFDLLSVGTWEVGLVISCCLVLNCEGVLFFFVGFEICVVFCLVLFIVFLPIDVYDVFSFMLCVSI
jgi:hypothetical protein